MDITLQITSQEFERLQALTRRLNAAAANEIARHCTLTGVAAAALSLGLDHLITFVKFPAPTEAAPEPYRVNIADVLSEPRPVPVVEDGEIKSYVLGYRP